MFRQETVKLLFLNSIWQFFLETYIMFSFRVAEILCIKKIQILYEKFQQPWFIIRFIKK